MKKFIFLIGLFLSTTNLVCANQKLQKAIDAFDQEQYQIASQLLNELKQGKEYASSAHYYLGRIAYEQKNFDQAADLLERAIELEPVTADEHYWYAMTECELASQASIFTVASYALSCKEHFQKALQLEPKHVLARKGLGIYYASAPSIAGGSIEQALAQAKQLEKIAPLQGQLLKLQIYVKDENQAQIAAQANLLIESYSDSIEAMYRAGFALQNLQQYQRATQAFELAQSQKASTKQAHYFRLFATYQIGRTAVFSQSGIEQGIQAFKTYLASERFDDLPEQHWVELRLAQLYLMADQKVIAQQLVQKLQKVYEKDSRFDRTLAELAKKI